MEKYPELVHLDADGYYMVDGMNAWKLVKAIQELDEKTSKLEKENQELKQRIEALENK